MEPLTLFLVGVGLAAAAGFRVFVPPLLLAVAAGVGLVELPAGSEWLSHPGAVAVLAVATFLEIAAYYIPLIDNLLDTITTPLALIAGTVLTASVMPEMEPWLRWVLAAVVGGGAAGSVQAVTTVARATSAGTTATLGNPVISTGELVGAVGLSLVSLFAPVLAGLLVLLIVVVGVRVTARRRNMRSVQRNRPS